MNTFLKTESEISKWLDSHGVTSYTLLHDDNYGFKVDVDGDVDLRNKKLDFIPVKFNFVSGSVKCSQNNLIGLEWAPVEVKGFFFVGWNKLKSLEFFPQKVGKYISCTMNQLTSLEFIPSKVNGFFDCSGNKLKTLKYCPNEVGGDFYCDTNFLSSLEFCPETIDGEFRGSYNQLISLQFFPNHVGKKISIDKNPQLGSIQKMTGFDEIYLEHLRVSEIISFNKELHASLVNSDCKVARKNKI